MTFPCVRKQQQHIMLVENSMIADMGWFFHTEVMLNAVYGPKQVFE